MKKLMYLLVAGSLSVFAACGGASTTEGVTTDVAVEEVATDVAVEVLAEAVGCQVEGGACLADHSCCTPKEAAACCCGDATCDGSCHEDGAATEEVHDHGAEGHSHE